MRSSAITQVALVAISIVIIFTYIRPTFVNVQEVQEEIKQYEDATAKALEYNAKLEELLIRQKNITDADNESLNNFLPENMDTLAVMDDLRSIVVKNDAELQDIDSGEVLQPNDDVEFEDYFDEQSVTANRFVTQDFTLSFITDYQSFKNILKDMESAEYIMEIQSLDFGSSGDEPTYDSFLDVDKIEFKMVVNVYSLAVN